MRSDSALLRTSRMGIPRSGARLPDCPAGNRPSFAPERKCPIGKPGSRCPGLARPDREWRRERLPLPSPGPTTGTPVIGRPDSRSGIPFPRTPDVRGPMRLCHPPRSEVGSPDREILFPAIRRRLSRTGNLPSRPRTRRERSGNRRAGRRKRASRSGNRARRGGNHRFSDRNSCPEGRESPIPGRNIAAGRAGTTGSRPDDPGRRAGNPASRWGSGFPERGRAVDQPRGDDIVRTYRTSRMDPPPRTGTPSRVNLTK